MSSITVILPYYNQPEMLRAQLRNWGCYTDHTRKYLKLIVVDDGSQMAPALDVMRETNHAELFQSWGAELYRIKEDIPWNRGEARNIGAKHAGTPWILQLDLDHVLPPTAAEQMVLRQIEFEKQHWYRFRRFRVGAADHTRNKDSIPRDARYGEIKPHIDSYLCTPERYWQAGGYNEDFSGCLGGGSPFLSFMSQISEPQMASHGMYLHVYTSDETKDASAALDRTPGEYKRRRAELTQAGKLKGHDPFRIPYERVL